MVVTSTVTALLVTKFAKNIKPASIGNGLNYLFSKEHPRLPKSLVGQNIKTATVGGQMLILRT